MEKTSRRLPSLDGARALSIILVIASHFAFGRPGLPVIWRIDYGNLGVRVFFVISGFLITSLLQQEFESTGRISLKDFYMRRCFRILPAYYAYVAIVVLLIPTGLLWAQYSDIVPAVAYYSNYKHIGWTLGQSWSLAVEEQFYLLWPAAIVLLGWLRARYICIAVLLVSPALRAIYWHEHVGPTYIQNAFETVCDALAMGCLLALLRGWLWAIDVYRRFVETYWSMGLLVIALVFIAAQPPLLIRDAIGLPLLNLGIATALDGWMRYPTRGPARLLNTPVVVWLGTLSYSLYLWQQVFTQDCAHRSITVGIVCMLTAAAASYYGVERPFVALGKRMKTSSPVDNCVSPAAMNV